jgi:hypothetical protein
MVEAGDLFHLLNLNEIFSCFFSEKRSHLYDQLNGHVYQVWLEFLLII